jgi:rhodanese-related sulfurtransferase
MINPRALHDLMARGERLHLVDVRTPGEYAHGHAQGAVSLPLDAIDADQLAMRLGSSAGTESPLYLICASGQRAEMAARRLHAQSLDNLTLVDGGTEGWVKSGLPVQRTTQTLSLEQQTQIALGVLMLLTLAKGILLHPLFFALVGLLGIGLIVAGITARCSLTSLVARLPWNRDRNGAPVSPVQTTG